MDLATSSRSQNLDKGIGDDCPAPPNYTERVVDVWEPPPSPNSWQSATVKLADKSR